MKIKRIKMVEEQIKARGIKNAAILKAMETVERHIFVPLECQNDAYGDYPLPIGYNQTISQPYIVALMTELIAPSKEDKVLEIGTGSGYQAAVLSLLVKEVYTMDIVPELSAKAKELLTRNGYSNVHVIQGDGYQGRPENAPYDKIIVTAAPAEIPELLLKQLKIGGKMVIPVGTFFQELILLEKTEKDILKKTIIPVRFVPMVRSNAFKE